MSSKSIFIILSYTVSKLARFLRHSEEHYMWGAKWPMWAVFNNSLSHTQGGNGLAP